MIMISKKYDESMIMLSKYMSIAHLNYIIMMKMHLIIDTSSTMITALSSQLPSIIHTRMITRDMLGLAP